MVVMYQWSKLQISWWKQNYKGKAFANEIKVYDHTTTCGFPQLHSNTVLNRMWYKFSVITDYFHSYSLLHQRDFPINRGEYPKGTLSSTQAVQNLCAMHARRTNTNHGNNLNLKQSNCDKTWKRECFFQGFVTIRRKNMKKKENAFFFFFFFWIWGL